MRYALVNPLLELRGLYVLRLYSAAFSAGAALREGGAALAGHQVLLIDAFMEGLTPVQVRRRLDRFAEDFLVVPTAPSYLFWRCPQPELRIPRNWIAALGRRSAKVIVIGPHGSVTPLVTLSKTGADVVLRGEPDQTLPQLATMPWEMIPGCCWHDAAGTYRSAPGLGVTDMRAIGSLDYSDYPVERHAHMHHIFPGNGADHLRRGAEVEFARGCPYSCTFCNKTLFRNKYRERELSSVMAEIDQLIARGVDYIYFIDEIFGVGKQVRLLLEEIAKRPVSIGFQSRIDLWNEETFEPARAGPLCFIRVRH